MRPPFALHRLHAPAGQPSRRRPDARLIYQLTRPLADGRTALRVTPLELLERLARLIPPPRAHRHRHHGVLAPNARLRPDVVRYGRPDHELRRLDDLQGAARASSGDGLDDTTRTPSPARIRWAQPRERWRTIERLCDSAACLMMPTARPARDPRGH